ncbi:unnamed protein product [Paramecium pentaurelia]|uniref:Uncharacterized protein n=1 Tax=Paramecium pentaurelia TaxID=43138 RepID=A0A8S1XB29_9CILI|nr:unnamed protein product [Paramecium pentaurelia]
MIILTIIIKNQSKADQQQQYSYFNLNLNNQIGLHKITKRLKFIIGEKSLESFIILIRSIDFIKKRQSIQRREQQRLFKRQDIKDFSFGVPYTYGGLGQQISIQLLQKYLLNTLKIRFQEYGFLYNESVRYYDIIVYAKLDQEQIKFM